MSKKSREQKPLDKSKPDSDSQMALEDGASIVADNAVSSHKRSRSSRNKQQ